MPIDHQAPPFRYLMLLSATINANDHDAVAQRCRENELLITFSEASGAEQRCSIEIVAFAANQHDASVNAIAQVMGFFRDSGLRIVPGRCTTLVRDTAARHHQ